MHMISFSPCHSVAKAPWPKQFFLSACMLLILADFVGEFVALAFSLCILPLFPISVIAVFSAMNFVNFNLVDRRILRCLSTIGHQSVNFQKLGEN